LIENSKFLNEQNSKVQNVISKLLEIRYLKMKISFAKDLSYCDGVMAQDYHSNLMNYFWSG